MSADQDGAPLDEPYRGPRDGLPRGLPFPPDHVPLLRGWHLRKSWRYVTFWSAETVLCAAEAKVGPLRQEYWGVWDRPNRRLWKRTHAFRHRVHGPPERLLVDDGDVVIELPFEPAETFELYRPEGSAYIWSRKEFTPRARGSLMLGDERRELNGVAFVDISAGYHPRRTSWRWFAGAGPDAGGGTVAWNLITGLFDTPTSSERTVWAGGPGTEVGPLTFSDDLARVSVPGGGELTFTEEARLSIRRNFVLLRTTYEHAFGTYSGSLPGGLEVREAWGVRERFDALW